MISPFYSNVHDETSRSLLDSPMDSSQFLRRSIYNQRRIFSWAIFSAGWLVLGLLNASSKSLSIASAISAEVRSHDSSSSSSSCPDSIWGIWFFSDPAGPLHCRDTRRTKWVRVRAECKLKRADACFAGYCFLAKRFRAIATVRVISVFCNFAVHKKTYEDAISWIIDVVKELFRTQSR